MTKNQQKIFQGVGVFGTLFWILSFVLSPSFPTPDKLLILLICVFMIFKQAIAMLKRILPFVLVLLAYESFRGIADKLNSHVNYLLAPDVDKFLFGNLPTVYLQNWLWHGHVQWYDFVFYLAYMLHFILPLGLAILVWKTREKHYWRLVSTYAFTAFAGFLTFLLLPAAPPWMAARDHYIQPIVRISSDVWFALGLKDFPSVYNHISPNPVAAIPSLHAAWATLLVIFVYILYGKRWATLACLYPFLIYIGTIYEGEHYAFDVIAGIFYALGAYFATPYLMRKSTVIWHKLKPKLKYSSNTKTVSKSKR
jgi:membrane-associated phospholipid phosphatase